MPNFSIILNLWPSDEFAPRLCAAVKQLGARGLPLQKGLSQGNVALDDDMLVRVLTVAESEEQLQVTLGIQYTSIVTGCSCTDDPSPLNILPEYCETELLIDRHTGETEIRLR
ncbi:hypothetical protein A9404_02355 [Halothiobacillus diazotrophicus]|uniref:Uncharacterized protein n=1 Tax=Halothiobacillus diazotrophicus TaxID=1860122 RepID=A0A191ZES8_9GAMM|nr:hypothetical protein [Halothiobacillus diazotrophicus]ANJ66374.1 hypothetical protein A9404_02355 [Halothiobacillus diazotrophicus]